MGLDLTLVGIEHLALSLSASEGGTADEMVDGAQHETRPDSAGLRLRLH
jgi:hypothetical protein